MIIYRHMKLPCGHDALFSVIDSMLKDRMVGLPFCPTCGEAISHSHFLHKELMERKNCVSLIADEFFSFKSGLAKMKKKLLEGIISQKFVMWHIVL